MKPLAALFIVLAALSSHGQSTDRLLDAIAAVESSNNPNAVGDGGKALGQFQLHRAAWEDARKIEPTIGEHRTGALNRETSRRAARIYVTNLTAQLHLAMGRAPKSGEVYAAFNLGLTGFSKRGFDLSRCPKITQRAAVKLERILSN